MDACGYDCPSVSSVNYHYLTNASSERDGVRVEGERERESSDLQVRVHGNPEDTKHGRQGFLNTAAAAALVV